MTADLKIARAVLQNAQKEFYTAISNAALNARQGAVGIPLHLIPFLRHHNHHFDSLCDCRKSILFKQHLILQKGGAFPIIVSLLATMLGSIGGEFIMRLLHKND